MANRLKDATSPYLLQHADNPVDWWPWSDEAFDEARRRDVPVLLSVGYAACHWCHVMAHESFEDPATAALMNERLVAIKVDREERPDVDAVYMTATQAMTGQGGWPMTVFMTPDREPFYCGTYFPRPTFQQLIRGVTEAWNKDRSGVQQQAARVTEALASNASATARALRDGGDSGALAGLAGTPDMRQVLARASQGDAGAELALAAYLHRLRGLIGAMAAALGGLDTLVFTGGVGENSAEIRAQAAAGLGFLGVALDEQRNAGARGDTDITAPGAVVRGFVVAAREDIEIARQVREVLRR